MTKVEKMESESFTSERSKTVMTTFDNIITQEENEVITAEENEVVTAEENEVVTAEENEVVTAEENEVITAEENEEELDNNYLVETIIWKNNENIEF